MTLSDEDKAALRSVAKEIAAGFRPPTEAQKDELRRIWRPAAEPERRAS